MSDIQLGGFAGLRGYIRLFKRGNWYSRWVMADDEAPAGVFDGTLWGESIKGYAKRSGNPYLLGQIEAVGGQGNIGPFRTVPAKDYRYASFADIARDIVVDAGESIAEEVLVGSDQQLIGWTRFNGSWISELERLCTTRNTPNGVNDGTTWKVRLSDGKIEIRPTPEQDTTPGLTLLADIVGQRMRVYALDDETQGLVVQPGDRFDGIIVDTVEYQVEPDDLKLNVWYHLTSEVATVKDPRFDRLTALWQDIFDVSMARYRDNNVDPVGYYFGTVRSVRSNGDVDIEADDLRIGFVNDVPIFSGLPGWQITPIPKDGSFPGTRVLFGWAGGDKSQKCCIAWAATPAVSLDTATIEAATLVEYKVPTHRVIGNSEVVSSGGNNSFGGDDRTEHDVGIGPALTLADALIQPAAGDSGAVTGLSGTDCALTVAIQAASSGSGTPPSNGGDAVIVFPKRGFGSSANGAVISAVDSTSVAVQPYVEVLSNQIKIGVGKGLTNGQSYKFSVIIKV